MNLILFTVELERTRPQDRALYLRTRAGDSERPPRFGAFAGVVVAALCVCAAAAAGWRAHVATSSPLT